MPPSVGYYYCRTINNEILYMYIRYVFLLLLVSMTVIATDSRRHKTIPKTAHRYYNL
jgi:hypothetical protein